MVTKANGPRQVDYQRLIRACRREKVKKIEYHIGSATIVIPLDGASDAKPEQEGVKLNW